MKFESEDIKEISYYRATKKMEIVFIDARKPMVIKTDIKNFFDFSAEWIKTKSKH